MDKFSDATLQVAQIIKYYEVSLLLNRPSGKYCAVMIFFNSLVYLRLLYKHLCHSFIKSVGDPFPPNLQTVRARDLKFCDNVQHPMCVICHVSYSTCHMSHVICYVSHDIIISKLLSSDLTF